MKVLVQDSESGLYYKLGGQYVPDSNQATDFRDSLEAFDYCARHPEQNLQIHLLASNPKESVVINPAPQLDAMRRTGGLENGVNAPDSQGKR